MGPSQPPYLSSPSRVTGLAIERTTRGVEVAWTPSPERDVRTYIVAYGPPGNPLARRLATRAPRATLPALPAGYAVAVKAVNQRSLEGWDWARGSVP